jgi:hypothetical protein
MVMSDMLKPVQKGNSGTDVVTQMRHPSAFKQLGRAEKWAE